MAMTSPFRRSAAVETKKKGGRGGGGSWHDRFKMPQNVSTPFVLVAGDYLDPNPPAEQVEIDPATGRPREVKNAYHKRKKHRRKLMEHGKELFMDEECSAGNDPHNPQPCVGCFAIDSGDKSVTVSDQYTFTLLHLVPYHSAPVIQDNGQILQRKDNSGPVLNWFECTGRSCNFCRTRQGQPPVLQQGEKWPGYTPQMIGDAFGRRRYLEVGKGHLSNLQGWDTAISSRCGNCKAELITEGFACPTCNNLVIDMSSDPRTDAQIAEAVAKPYPCMHCQRAVMAKELVACDVCASQNRQALQQGLFDVVLHGMRQGEGTKSQMMLSSFEVLEEFEQRLHPNYRQMMQGKTLRQYVQEIAKPFNFDDMFKPKDLPDQAKRLRLPMPGQAMPQQQQSYYGGGFTPQAGAPNYGTTPQPQQFYGAPQFSQPQQPQQPQYGAPMPGYQPMPQGPVQTPYAPYPQPPAAPPGYPAQAAPMPQPQPGYAPYPPAQPQPQYAPYPQQQPNGPQAAPVPYPVPGKPTA
jgi:hypothetical protein